MGVRFLESFMFKFVPNGTTPIDIRKQIKDYKIKKNKKALIVIDFYGFINHWQPAEEILCGHRAKQYLARAKEFFEELIKAGAELVFFIDGPIGNEKTDTWFKRQSNRYNDFIALFDGIEDRSPVRYLTGLIGEVRSTLINPLLRQVAKEVGSLHISFHVECDLDVASFACKNNALAVMADDTDFLIYPGEWSVWSIRKLNVETFTTIQVNKLELRRHLDLTDSKLPLFASLCGNDIVPFDDLKSFHNTMGHPRVKFANIAAFVRRFYINYTNENMEVVAEQVFHSKAYASKLKSSLAAYDITNEALRIHESDPFLQQLLEDDHHHHYKILKRFPYDITVQFDDMRLYENGQTKGVSYSDLALMLHLRRVGLLLNDQKDKNLKETIYIKRSHNRSYEKISVTPDYPVEHDIGVPVLEDLIFRNGLDNLDTIRFKIFEWLHFNAFNSEVLFEQSDDFILLLSTLGFLMKKSDMTEEEAALFILSYNDVLCNRVPDQLECPKVLEPRAFRLVHMVLKVVPHIFVAMTITGLGHRHKPFLFDGIYFHTQYVKWIEMSTQEKNQNREEIKHLTAVFKK